MEISPTKNAVQTCSTLKLIDRPFTLTNARQVNHSCQYFFGVVEGLFVVFKSNAVQNAYIIKWELQDVGFSIVMSMNIPQIIYIWTVIALASGFYSIDTNKHFNAE